jgi:hypothetical protein
MMFVGLDQGRSYGDPTEPWMLHRPTFRPTDAAVGDVAKALLAGYLAAVDLVNDEVA